MSSNFDGKTYLQTCASLQLKHLIVGEVMSFDVANTVSALYGDRGLDLTYGSIKYGTEKILDYPRESEYLSFNPGNFDNIFISQMEVGNRKNLYSDLPTPNCNLFVSGEFVEGDDNSIKSLININPNNPAATATVVIKDKGAYRGIYCISLNEKVDSVSKAIVEYFDGSVIETIESAKNSLYPMDELTSYSSSRLKRVGFKPNRVAMIDYVELLGPYEKLINLVGKTYQNGSLDKFKDWITKLFVDNKEIGEKKGPILGKKFL